MSMKEKKEYRTEIEESSLFCARFGEIPEGSFFYSNDVLHCKIHPLYEDACGQYCIVNAICIGDGCALIFEDSDPVIPVKRISIF